MKNTKNKEQNLGDLLLLLRRNIIESVRKEGLKEDLTFSQLEILHFIGIDGEKTMKSIADYLKITPPSVTELIKEMERKNIVRRIMGEVDRRVVSIKLTDSARKNYISISKNKEAILNQIVSKLNNKDKKELVKIINKLTKE